MIWTKWLPWRFVIRHLARTHGFLDPLNLLAQMRRFAQPSEVGEPVELLRAGMVFHARGLINSKVLQHNLDWVWPYWVERQFDPRDDAFIPRAFSITHVNLTHRNWTAIGLPDCEALPIVDPRGLLTPLYDGWSLDGWIHCDDGRTLLPSRVAGAKQRLEIDEGVCVVTESELSGLALESRAWVENDNGVPVCKFSLKAWSDSPGWLVLSLRPCNPEGVSFIHRIELCPDKSGWNVNDEQCVEFSKPAERQLLSDYAAGDVHIHFEDKERRSIDECDVGLATGAAMYRVDKNMPTELMASIPLVDEDGDVPEKMQAWSDALDNSCRLQCPDPHWQFLYDTAIRSLVLHSPDDVYPGPYTYKRFWFRDAAFIIQALLCAGLISRAERSLDRFPERQTLLGYFRSQEGEWDSNGEALWIMQRFCAFTGQLPKESWRQSIEKGAQWIIKKRLSRDLDAAHAGLLPAGFSAEHLGPNDFYYWDDFWGVAGLQTAGVMLAGWSSDAASRCGREADDFQATIDRCLARDAKRLGRPAMPASPYRRLDSGAIGSLVMGYPLRLTAGNDERLGDSVRFLRENCEYDGAFFQDMIHSGMNAYLTLHIAQVELRAGDPNYLDSMDAVAALASPTGQWPEAIHPRTRGGCMGDGHHVWASAEWVVMLRNCFLREEGAGLIFCSGIPARWLEHEQEITFGPAPTAFGVVTLKLQPRENGKVEVAWEARWHDKEPAIELRLPGFVSAVINTGTNSMMLRPQS